MQPRAADDPERVSFHAVARYVQRILHIDVSEEFETEKARAHGRPNSCPIKSACMRSDVSAFSIRS